jgi:hypothetical protein
MVKVNAMEEECPEFKAPCPPGWGLMHQASSLFVGGKSAMQKKNRPSRC